MRLRTVVAVVDKRIFDAAVAKFSMRLRADAAVVDKQIFDAIVAKFSTRLPDSARPESLERV